MGFDHEIDCIAAAHELDLLTTPYAFDPDQARRLAEAGADIVVAHMGLTTKGSIGAKTAKTLGDCVRDVTNIALAGKAVRERSARPLSWRTDRLTRRCPVHSGTHSRSRWLLWSELDGAAPYRDGNRPASSRFRGIEARYEWNFAITDVYCSSEIHFGRSLRDSLENKAINRSPST